MIKNVLATILFLLIFTGQVVAQSFGVDTLFGPRFQQAVRSIPMHMGASCFVDEEITGADCVPFARGELAAGRAWFRAQLLWSDAHQFGDKDVPKMKRLAGRFEPICAAYPGRVEISPFCEHNLTNPDKYLDIAQRAAPSCRIVNTPWRGAFSKRYKNEIHGDHAAPAGPYNYSFDGTNAVDANVEAMKRKHARAEKFLFWTPRENGKWSMKDTTPRPQRRAWPTKEYEASVVYLAGSKGATNIPKGWLIKSHAERHGPADLKGDKLLIISPVRADSVQLKRAGKIVGTLRYYGPFDGMPGTHRYYAQTMGFQLGAGLEVWIGGKNYGVINGGFRDGIYR